MDRNFRKPARGEADTSPPSEAWLFAQALLGKPIPNPASAQAEARAKREQLEWLASFSTEHEAQLRRLQSEEAEARHQRDLLQWLATFSTEHERELRRLQAREAEAIDAQASWERFYEDYSASLAEWNEIDHPRNPKGTPDGGQWVGKGGGSGSAGAANKFAPTSTSGQRKVVDQHSAPARMLELATAWHETNDLLRQTRGAIEKLPARIASEHAQLALGGRAAPIHAQNLAKAQRDLRSAQELAPQLENQLHDLQKDYSDSGYDALDYASWTPSETQVSGRGIEQVGRAVAASGSPAGVKPTGDEFEIALAAPTVLHLGRAALRKALGKHVNAGSVHQQLVKLHQSLDSIAQTQRTTAILETSNGTRIVASGGRDLSPAQRVLLGPGDIAAKLPKVHAEITALEHAVRNGLTPTRITASRPFCADCVHAIENAGGKITSSTTAIFPR